MELATLAKRWAWTSGAGMRLAAWPLARLRLAARAIIRSTRMIWREEVRKMRPVEAKPKRLNLGDRAPLVLRRETVIASSLERPVRIAWISDLHLWRRSSIRTVRNVLLAVHEAQPDVVILGGDLVDRGPGLRLLERLVRGLSRVAPIYALPGNHDEAFGVNRVAAAVRRAGGHWLNPGATVVANGTVSLVTGEFGGFRTILPTVIVACLHDPETAEAWDGRAHAILAGHLHGGQIMLAEASGRSWPCALRYRWCGPRFRLPFGTELIVGRGAGDLFPVRWRCPREVLCVDLVPAPKASEKKA